MKCAGREGALLSTAGEGATACAAFGVGSAEAFFRRPYHSRVTPVRLHFLESRRGAAHSAKGEAHSLEPQRAERKKAKT